jgi:hypothetical protein
VLRFGGGKALTKQAVEDGALKFHLPVEEVNNTEGTNSIAFNSLQTSAKLEERTVMLIKNENDSTMLGKVVSEIYDLEKCDETEKQAKIDLDKSLYQMEKDC